LSAIANFEEDAAAMLDSLYELFQERGDRVIFRVAQFIQLFFLCGPYRFSLYHGKRSH